MPSPGSTEATGGPAGGWFGVPETVTEPGLAEESPAEVESAEAAAPGTGALQNLTATFCAWDHLGTIRLVSSADRSVIERHDYEPYGVELRPILNQTGNTHQFNGHERDLASGYDYMHFRYFAASTGRFMKPDNIPGNLGDPQSWNLYAYANNNPVNLNDPTGHIAGGGNIFSEQAPPGAFWDGGVGNWWLSEAKGTIFSSIPWTIWVHLNVIIDRNLDFNKAKATADKQVQYANVDMRDVGIQYKVDSVQQGTLGIVPDDPMRLQAGGFHFVGDTQLLKSNAANAYVTNSAGLVGSSPGWNAGNLAVLNIDKAKSNTMSHELKHLLGNRGPFSDPMGVFNSGWDVWNDVALSSAAYLSWSPWMANDIWWLRHNAQHYSGDGK